MSAVSAEFPHAPANVDPPSGRAPDSSGDQADGKNAGGGQAGEGQRARRGTTIRTPNTDFGPNEWLVDELYQRYQADPGSVDRAWWNFFADYRPEPVGGSRPAGQSAGAIAAPLPEPAQAPATAAPPGAPAAQPRAGTPAGGTPAGGTPAGGTPAGGRPGAGPGTGTRPGGPEGPASGSAATLNGEVATAGQAARAASEIRLRGAASRTVANMEASLAVPTATSVRAVPAKLLVDNRIVVNNHLARGRGGKVSFTHLIGYAVVRALAVAPELNDSYAESDGKPVLVRPEHVNLGLAIDVQKDDGTRQLLVPNIKAAEQMDFRQFWLAYEDTVRKTRSGRLTVADFAGTTISLTNPGTIGTVQSVPRLMPGQGCIVGVGAMEYPAAYQGASAETLARLAVSQTVTLTSTYDHRIIQGAQSGEFLRIISGLLLGEHDFYDQVFASLRIPYEPVRWVRDIPAAHENDISKAARVHELIHAYRVRGHLLADTDPLGYVQRKHPDLDINQHGLTLWDLERSESLIPLLDAVLNEAAKFGLHESVIGMAHRGRLNVLANIVGKSYGQIFNEFEGYVDPSSTHGSGDVKYHLGAEGRYTSADGASIPVTLVANPSHLEAVDPVLEGVVRAKQDVLDIGEPGFTVLPVLIHGDAAFAGQGVVAETLELSQLRGYRTGGTVHIVVNNQVGFTTDPRSSRSSVYATDVARTIQAPIFHVNGDDPEAVVRVGRLAFAYRAAFAKDVVIDMVCYRRRGHNEADNPSFTQPLMYDLIDAKRSTRKLYTEALIGRGDITLGEAEQILRDYQAELERAFTETRDAITRPAEPGSVRPTPPQQASPIDHT